MCLIIVSFIKNYSELTIILYLPNLLDYHVNGNTIFYIN